MTAKRRAKPAPDDLAVTYYTVVSLLALVALLLALIERGVVVHLAVLPALIGLVAVAVRWSGGPVAVLLTLAFYLYWFRTYASGAELRLADVVLCAAFLAYAVANYRLQALTGHVFPLDPRRREGTPRWRLGFVRLVQRPPVARQRRAGRLVSEWEIGAMVLSLPAWALLAQVCWYTLPSGSGYTLGLPPQVWRAMLLTWIVGLGAFVTVALVGYWNRRKMTADEAALFLQDTLWQQTRREQRVINRWLARARVRQGRRKDET